MCLEEGREGQDAAAEQALTKLTIEASSVVCCLTHFNSETVKALHQLKLDTGQPIKHQPGDAFYSDLVVSHFGAHACARRLFLTRAIAKCMPCPTNLPKTPSPCLPHPHSRKPPQHQPGGGGKFVQPHSGESLLECVLVLPLNMWTWATALF